MNYNKPCIICFDLLDNIIKSNLRDQAITRRLEQISYSAIDGQRQKEDIYQPEGVQMLGQMGREKPLTAITKEMIKEYQEEEQAKPFLVDGEARKYMGATYEPQFETTILNCYFIYLIINVCCNFISVI